MGLGWVVVLMLPDGMCMGYHACLLDCMRDKWRRELVRVERRSGTDKIQEEVG